MLSCSGSIQKKQDCYLPVCIQSATQAVCGKETEILRDADDTEETCGSKLSCRPKPLETICNMSAPSVSAIVNCDAVLDSVKQAPVQHFYAACVVLKYNQSSPV